MSSSCLPAPNSCMFTRMFIFRDWKPARPGTNTQPCHTITRPILRITGVIELIIHMHILNMDLTCAQRIFKRTAPNSDGILKPYRSSTSTAKSFRWLKGTCHSNLRLTPNSMHHASVKMFKVAREKYIKKAQGTMATATEPPWCMKANGKNGRPEDPAAHSHASGRLRGHLFTKASMDKWNQQD